MNSQPKYCAVDLWDASQAWVRAPFDITPILSDFQQGLYHEMTLRGITPVQRTPDAALIVYGRYLRIDQGNQLERVVATFLAGEAIVEVDGGLWVADKGTWGLHAVSRRGWGLYGGEAWDLLKWCAGKCAESIAQQVLLSLQQARVM